MLQHDAKRNLDASFFASAPIRLVYRSLAERDVTRRNIQSFGEIDRRQHDKIVFESMQLEAVRKHASHFGGNDWECIVWLNVFRPALENGLVQPSSLSSSSLHCYSVRHDLLLPAFIDLLTTIITTLILLTSIRPLPLCLTFLVPLLL